MNSKWTPINSKGYWLFHQGTLALSKVSQNGIRTDTKYLRRTANKLKNKIKNKQQIFAESEIGKIWRRLYPQNINWDSDQQLRSVLYTNLKLQSFNHLKKVNEESLLYLDRPELVAFLSMKKLKKALGTYILPFIRESHNGIMHPDFDLNTARTMRSSSSNPNFQNIPVRNKEVSKLVRTAIIPRKGNKIMEIDYKGIEVGTSCAYHKDPRMMHYQNDKTKDMHRDMSMECYLIPRPEMVVGMVRYCAKNKFVFPQFYGDYYASCAIALWDAIPSMKLNVQDKLNTIPMKMWLQKQGVNDYQDFEHHIKDVENKFWNKRFKVYNSWKKKHVRLYLKKGYCDSLSGFRFSGIMSRNDVINYTVQAAAFHILLTSLILMQNEIERVGLNTLIIGQIHDSLVLDMPEEEEEIIIKLVDDIMKDKVRKIWSFINVPLEVEIEVTPVNGSWYEKKDIKV